MKYSQPLPKRTYESTIGDFSIVDLCSYYEINQTEIETTPVKVDNSQTLIEKAYSIYGDVNSFWLFLFSNNTINPFKLTKQSKTTLLDDISNTTTVYARTGQYEIYSPAGSIVAPFAATGGSAWQFSYVGNFSLTGGFALAKAYNTFSKRTYLAEPVGITFSVLDMVNPIIKGETYYASEKVYSIETVDSQGIVTKDIKYSSTTDKEVYLSLDSELPVFKKGSGSYEPTGVTQSEVTFTDFAETQSTYIEAYVPYAVGYKAFNLIKQKYVI